MFVYRNVQEQVVIQVPTWTGKPGKWEGIFQSGKSEGILSVWKSGNHDIVAVSLVVHAEPYGSLYLCISHLVMNIKMIGEDHTLPYLHITPKHTDKSHPVDGTYVNRVFS